MTAYRCDVCGEYTERDLTISFYDSLYSAGSVDLCPRCMTSVIDMIRGRVPSHYHEEARKSFNEIERKLNLKSTKNERIGDINL